MCLSELDFVGGWLVSWLVGFYDISTLVSYKMQNTVYIYIYIYIERERERETERQTQTERERDTQTDRQSFEAKYGIIF